MRTTIDSEKKVDRHGLVAFLRQYSYDDGRISLPLLESICGMYDVFRVLGKTGRSSQERLPRRGSLRRRGGGA